MASNQDSDFVTLEEFRQDRLRDDAARIGYEQQATALHGLKVLETAIRSFGVDPAELIREETTSVTPPKTETPVINIQEQPEVRQEAIETSAPADTYAKVLSMEEKRTQQNPGQNTELNVAEIQANVARAYAA